MAETTWGDAGLSFASNSTRNGCALVGTPGAGEGVVLAQDPIPADANTAALWRMDEASWNGTPGEILDASGNGITGRAYNGATTAADALGRCGDFRGSKCAVMPNVPFSGLGEMFTVECWIETTSLVENGYPIYAEDENIAVAHYGGTQWALRCHGTAWNYCYFYTELGGWKHFTFMCSGLPPTGIMSVHVNGQLSTSRAVNSSKPFMNYNLCLGATTTSSGQVTCYMDDVRISNVLRYSQTESFVGRVWYKSAAQNGSVQPFVDISATGLSGQVPSAISWTAETGDPYGKIKAVYLRDTDGWTAVGGAYPTSPITTGLSDLTLAADSCLRFEFEPYGTIQEGTPTLQGVTLTHAAAVSPRVVSVGAVGSTVRLGDTSIIPGVGSAGQLHIPGRVRY